MPPSRDHADVSGTARLLVVLLAFAWGLNWIAAAIALPEVPPWSLRFAGSGIGAITLFTAALLTGYSLRVPAGELRHVFVAGLLNVAAFNILSAFAQMNGATSRVIIINYSMPIWTTVLSRFLLGERLNAIRWIAITLCVVGLTVLVWPLFAQGLPPSVFYSLGCSLSFSFATVYLKWVKTKVEPLANAAWQLLFGWLVISVGMLAVDHYPRLWPLHTSSWLAILYIGFFGVGLAHFLWWSVVGKLSAITASIGVLLVPVVGVIASTVILGEKLTPPDIAGFVMIFAAAACVLLQPSAKQVEAPE